MSTIQFSPDTIHPVRSNGGGVYSTRLSRPNSIDQKPSAKDVDVEGLEDYKHDERDIKRKQVGLSITYLLSPLRAHKSTGVWRLGSILV